MIGVGEILVGFMLTWWGGALCWWDIRARRLPDWLTLPAIPLTWIAAAFSAPWAVFGGLGWSLSYLMLAMWRGGIGGGDIKLAASLGVLVMWAGGFSGLLAAIAGASLISLMLAVLLQENSIPHAPAMLAGGLLTSFLF